MNAKKNKWKRIFKKFLMAFLAIIFIPLLVVMTLEVYSIYGPVMEPIRYEAKNLDYWPTDGWRTSTPEEQGMESMKLLEMANAYRKTNSENQKIMIDSVTIVRNVL